jgi:hypothetical protein
VFIGGLLGLSYGESSLSLFMFCTEKSRGDPMGGGSGLTSVAGAATLTMAFREWNPGKKDHVEPI